MGLESKHGAVGEELVLESMPFTPVHDQAKVEGWYLPSIHTPSIGSIGHSFDQMSHNLMAVEIEVDGTTRSPPDGTAQDFHVESFSGLKIINGEREVKRPHV